MKIVGENDKTNKINCFMHVSYGTALNTLQILKIACLLCAAMLQAVTSGAQPVTKVAAGGEHSLFFKSDGSLWAMGENNEGQLGDGTYNNTNRPEQILSLIHI